MRHETAICPRCGSEMTRLYSNLTNPQTHKRFWQTEGWICKNPSCKEICRD